MGEVASLLRRIRMVSCQIPQQTSKEKREDCRVDEADISLLI